MNRHEFYIYLVFYFQCIFSHQMQWLYCAKSPRLLERFYKIFVAVAIFFFFLVMFHVNTYRNVCKKINLALLVSTF